MELAHFIQAHHLESVVYLIIFVGMFFEATFFLFSSMVLLAQHALNPAYTILAVTIGAFAEELAWYYAGLKLGKWSWLVRWTDKIAKPVDRHILERPFHTLIISKFVYGAHRAILARAGMLKMELKRFTKNAFASTGIWLAIVGALGYSLGASYEVFKRYLSLAEFLPLIIIIAYFVIDYLLSKRLKKSL